MDKYTVDLDQVLNDFEYSEFTDQHDQTQVINNKAPQHNNNFKNNHVKHSINNVFHSLNEYLNTDITPKISNEPSASSTVPETPPAITIIDNKLTKDDVNLTINHKEEETPTVKLLEVEAEEETVDQLVAVEEVPSIQLVDVEEKVVPSVDDPTPDPVIKETIETIIQEISANETETPSVVHNEEESIIDDVEKTDVNNDDSSDSIETVDDEEVEKVTKVGFDNDVDLDESELSKYLDELEKEYESVDEKVEEEAAVVVETTPQTNELEVDTVSTTHERPNNLPLAQPDVEEEIKTINLIGEPGSTPYNNVYVNKELPQKTVDNNNSDTECSTSASPTFSDVSTETTSSCTPSTDTVNDDQQPSSEAKPEAETTQDEATTNQTETPPAEVPTNPEPSTSSTTTTNDAANYAWLGKQAPLWIPDGDAMSCLHCDMKFTVIKRRHHCRACGLVLCSKCCNLKFHLDYLDDMARVCNKCHDILERNRDGGGDEMPRQQPNPNNPLEYCSTVPPHQQVSAANMSTINPPSVMVPVGVLKRQGSNKQRTNKSVMFCDGIRPGSDLTNLDNDFSYQNNDKGKSRELDDRNQESEKNVNMPIMDSETKSFIPQGEDLPPLVAMNKGDIIYSECSNGVNIMEKLREEVHIFAIQSNLLVHLKIITMDCCINKTVWCFSTEGLINVGQDEVVILLELLDDEKSVPKDVFLFINNIYMDAVKGTSVKEMGLSLHNASNFLNSKNHAGFVFIRPTFQCLQNLIKPKEPYLIGILIHRWETPWAKLFPLRLILRLGAEYRYYPSPIISNRFRDSVYVEIGHTIINLLADFRNFSYTLPQIRGLTIHMEDKNTTVTIPTNRYDQVMKSMNNSSDHILAFAGNFSSQADSHLVCIQDTQSNVGMGAYSTHAINIHNKPRKVTGASFIVFNGALKTSSGLTAKSSIVEDGLMIQIPSDHMVQVRESLRNMKNHTIQCGCINAVSDETVNIVWGEADVNFNINVFSPIDNKPMAGIPSIRVHNGKDFVNGNRLIRWTEVFIVQNESEASRNQDPIDISKVSETIAKATCTALVKYLDLLVSNNFYKIGIRANLNALFVAYSAGSNATKLPPIYMESLDNELVPVLHRHAGNDGEENTIILELIFRILRK